MAIQRDSRYPGRWEAADADYPLGGPKNRTTAESKDGTYLEKDWIADYEAFFQALMANASLSANGNADTAQASQFYDALIEAINDNLTPQATLQEALDGDDVDAYMPPDLVHKAFNQYGIGDSTTFVINELITKFNNVIASNLDVDRSQVILIAKIGDGAKKISGDLSFGRADSSNFCSQVLSRVLLSANSSGALNNFTVFSLGGLIGDDQQKPILCDYDGSTYAAIELSTQSNFYYPSAYAFNGYDVASDLQVVYRDECTNFQSVTTNPALINGAKSITENDKATTAQAQAGTNDEKYVTPLGLSESTLGSTQQSWQDVTGSRSAGVTYTNTTGRPIQVVVSLVNITTVEGSATVDGFTQTLRGIYTTSESAFASATFVVPEGSEYSYTGPASIILELR